MGSTVYRAKRQNETSPGKMLSPPCFYLAGNARILARMAVFEMGI